jgi:hypothetical protein
MVLPAADHRLPAGGNVGADAEEASAGGDEAGEHGCGRGGLGVAKHRNCRDTCPTAPVGMACEREENPCDVHAPEVLPPVTSLV